VYRELSRLILGKRIPGDLARATELARKALERSPGEAKNYDVYAWALMQGGHRTAARDSLEIATRLSPKDEQIRKRFEELRGNRP
jgi:Flp pilus assembly protein TadD